MRVMWLGYILLIEVVKLSHALLRYCEMWFNCAFKETRTRAEFTNKIEMLIKLNSLYYCCLTVSFRYKRIARRSMSITPAGKYALTGAETKYARFMLSAIPPRTKARMLRPHWSAKHGVIRPVDQVFTATQTIAYV